MRAVDTTANAHLVPGTRPQMARHGRHGPSRAAGSTAGKPTTRFLVLRRTVLFTKRFRSGGRCRAVRAGPVRPGGGSPASLLSLPADVAEDRGRGVAASDLPGAGGPAVHPHLQRDGPARGVLTEVSRGAVAARACGSGGRSGRPAGARRQVESSRSRSPRSCVFI